MLCYLLFWTILGFIFHFYIIFGTNLLTGGPVQICCFMPISVFRGKGISDEVITERNQLEKLFLEGKPPDGLGVHIKRYGRCSRGWGRAPPPASWDPRSSTDVLPAPIYTYVPKNFQNRTEIGSSAAVSLCSHQKPIGTLFRHPAGGGSHHRWPSSSSRRYP